MTLAPQRVGLNAASAIAVTDFRPGGVGGRDEAYRAAIGREEDRLAIHADVGRFGTDDPATWSMGDRLTFLELKLIDMLVSSSPKRSSVYRKPSILEGCASTIAMVH